MLISALLSVLSLLVGVGVSYAGLTKHWSQGLGLVIAGIITSVATRRSPKDSTMTALDG